MPQKPIIPHKVRELRERKKLDEHAKREGFENFETLLYDMYVVRRMSFYDIQKALFTPTDKLRRRFAEAGIKFRPRGGPNNEIVKLTPELIQEIARDGISAVAQRVGVTNGELSYALTKWRKERGL